MGHTLGPLPHTPLMDPSGAAAVPLPGDSPADLDAVVAELAEDDDLDPVAAEEGALPIASIALPHTSLLPPFNGAGPSGRVEGHGLEAPDLAGLGLSQLGVSPGVGGGLPAGLGFGHVPQRSVTGGPSSRSGSLARLRAAPHAGVGGGELALPALALHACPSLPALGGASTDLGVTLGVPPLGEGPVRLCDLAV